MVHGCCRTGSHHQGASSWCAGAVCVALCSKTPFREKDKSPSVALQIHIHLLGHMTMSHTAAQRHPLEQVPTRISGLQRRNNPPPPPKKKTLKERPHKATWAPTKQQANGHLIMFWPYIMVRQVQSGWSVSVHPQKHAIHQIWGDLGWGGGGDLPSTKACYSSRSSVEEVEGDAGRSSLWTLSLCLHTGLCCKPRLGLGSGPRCVMQIFLIKGADSGHGGGAVHKSP